MDVAIVIMWWVLSFVACWTSTCQFSWDNPNIIWFVAEQLRPTTLDAMPVGIFHNSHMGISASQTDFIYVSFSNGPQKKVLKTERFLTLKTLLTRCNDGLLVVARHHFLLSCVDLHWTSENPYFCQMCKRLDGASASQYHQIIAS